jgi:hypothetical protein
MCVFDVCQTVLLGGVNASVQSSIKDRYGASSFSAPYTVNVTAMTTSSLLLALSNVLAAYNNTLAGLSLLLGAGT